MTLGKSLLQTVITFLRFSRDEADAIIHTVNMQCAEAAEDHASRLYAVVINVARERYGSASNVLLEAEFNEHRYTYSPRVRVVITNRFGQVFRSGYRNTVTDALDNAAYCLSSPQISARG